MIKWEVRRSAQVTDATCWLAVARMLCGYTVNTKADFHDIQGLSVRDQDLRQLAMDAGLHVIFSNGTLTLNGIEELLKSGPFGCFGSHHAFLIAGIWGERIYVIDPFEDTASDWKPYTKVLNEYRWCNPSLPARYSFRDAFRVLMQRY